MLIYETTKYPLIKVESEGKHTATHDCQSLQNWCMLNSLA